MYVKDFGSNTHQDNAEDMFVHGAQQCTSEKEKKGEGVSTHKVTTVIIEQLYKTTPKINENKKQNNKNNLQHGRQETLTRKQPHLPKKLFSAHTTYTTMARSDECSAYCVSVLYNHV